MKKFSFRLAVFFCVMSGFVFGQPRVGRSAPLSMPSWKPPEARLKAKTPFAPKPASGNNIFKGDAETWLTDAIIKVESGHISSINDTQIIEYVAGIGNYLVSHSALPTRKYQFGVTASEQENAFCIGSGRIYIDLGMLRAVTSEDELAAIIGHEIGHDQFGHIPKTVTRQLFWMTGVKKVNSQAEVEKSLEDLFAAYNANNFAAVGERLLGWSRNDELQADKAGFYMMYKAGYNPEAMKNVFRRYVAEAKANSDYDSDYFFTLLFGSHPPSSQRVTALKWESMWIKMPNNKEESYKSEAFDAMKVRVAAM